MAICVVGGDGFVGRRIVRLLAKQDSEVISLDVNQTTSFADLGNAVRAERLDLTDFEAVLAVFLKHKPEVVINLSYVRESAPRIAFKVNVQGMDNFFEAARLAGVDRVVYSSSAAVNGYQTSYGTKKITEDDPLAPVGQYGVHKVFNEWQASEYRNKHGMTITGIRPTFVSGIEKTVGTVDHVHCIVKPARGEEVVLKHRNAMRCIVHGEDCADIFVRVARAKKPRHTIYTSGGELLSLGDIAGMVGRAIPDARIKFLHEKGEENPGAYLFDNSRVLEEFGMSYMPYEQRVARMIESVRRGDSLG